jgi:Fe-coproporphyrin III synthase
MTYYKKYLGYLYRKSFSKVKWGYFIFFVTNKCNAKCSHCFYWKNLNTNTKELSLLEIDKITKKLGNIEVLLLSGGEPFLRKDLFEVVSLFIKNNSVKVVSIPTNALLKETIISTTKRLSESFPNVTFSINPSIDDLWEKHDKMRGIKDCFKKSIETLKELEQLKDEKDNVEVVINTTVSNFNYENLDKIIEYFKKFNITYHNFELLRGNPKEKSINLPSFEKIKTIHRKITELRKYYINKNKKSGFIGKVFEKFSVLGVLKYTNKIKEDVLKDKDLPIVCSAGKNILVLEPEGDIKLCELHPKVGNLREYDYDIQKLLKNEKSVKLMEYIKKCKCTHVCFLNMSIAYDKKSLIKIPYYSLKKC